MSADPLLVRTVGLYGPLAAVAALFWWRRPGRRVLAGALLATLWNLPALWAVHLLAAGRGWWSFQPVEGAFDGLPADLWLGWAVLWGALPVLAAPRVPVAVLVPVAAWLDAVAMPACAPLLRLGGRWWAGELVAVAVALVPAVLLGRWTAENRRLGARTVLQAVCFGGLTFGLGTAVALHADGGSLTQLDRHPTWLLSLAVQLLLVPGALAVGAVTEFAVRGRGTPFPYDPPKRLVVTGPYAYVANPMQVAMTALLLGWAALLGSWGVAGAALLSAAFAAGLAAWHEHQQLVTRHGEAWRAYRRAVRAWLPRWRPFVPAESVLYVGLGCDVCEPVAHWIARRGPAGLKLVDARLHDGPPLRRITYVGADGHRADGVRAVSRAFEHLHLGWACAGWVLRLPVLVTVVQVLLDATGAGPRPIQPTDPTALQRNRAARASR